MNGLFAIIVALLLGVGIGGAIGPTALFALVLALGLIIGRSFAP